MTPWGRGSLRSPGTREWARATREKSRLEHEPLAVIPDSRCQTAQCCSFPRRVAASGFVRLFACAFASASAERAHRGFGAGGRRDSSNSVPPMRGGWSADRRTLSSGRACDARPPCPGATGTPLGAPPWRFSAGTHASVSRQWDTGAAATARATPSGLAVGVRTSLRGGSRRSVGRHSLLRLSGSSLEDAPP